MSDLDPLVGWGLRPVQAADHPALNPYLTSLADPLSDYTFSQIFTWRNSLRILWRQLHGHLCVFANGAGDLTLLIPPIGTGNGGGDAALAAAFELMDDYNAQHRVPERSRVEYASAELLARFDASRVAPEPMGTDYVYDVNRMIDLAGGDLASKRQAKNRFVRDHAHRVERYDAARHLAGCVALLESWKVHQDAQHPAEPTTNAIKRQKESLATELALRHADELGLKGLVVYVTRADGGESIRGFTFGEPLGRDQSSIVVEKTDLAVKGLAQFIFSEFCRQCWSDRPLVNAGDDWGLETLAWTKNSYRPVKLLQKYLLRKVPAVAVAVPPIDSGMGVSPMHDRDGHATGKPVIRAARKDDLPAMLELEQACFDAYRLSPRQLQYHQRNPNSVLRVAERGGRVIGHALALVRHHRSGMSGRLYSLVVRADGRGQGIGRDLLTDILADLVGRGVKRIYLEVERTNTVAIALYERLGFRSVGALPDYYGAGRDGVHMVAEITTRAPVPAPPIAA
jgi:ribosomal protein S18 acetylase RimI-like enzyme